jgi:hypothetical protein
MKEPSVGSSRELIRDRETTADGKVTTTTIQEPNQISIIVPKSEYGKSSLDLLAP